MTTSNRVLSVDPIDVSPDAAARMMRMQWRMPIGPVRDLVGWMESAGCLIFEQDLGTPRIDGLSQWIDDVAVIVVNVQAPTDRVRLTLAHELGHLCLHRYEVTETMEQEADQFAAEFLMPEDVIRPKLRNLTLGRLHDLKLEWAVSMQALIERASELGLLTSSKRTSLYKQLSYRGWRTSEPISSQLPVEKPRLSFEIGESLLARGLTRDEVSEISGFAARSNVDTPFLSPHRGLRVVGRK